MRKPIEARLPQQAFLDECIENGDCLCKESEVRKLEARLGEAEKTLKDIQEFIGEQVRISPFTIFSVIADYFDTLDQEKEKSDG